MSNNKKLFFWISIILSLGIFGFLAMPYVAEEDYSFVTNVRNHTFSGYATGTNTITIVFAVIAFAASAIGLYLFSHNTQKAGGVSLLLGGISGLISGITAFTSCTSLANSEQTIFANYTLGTGAILTGFAGIIIFVCALIGGIFAIKK